MPRSVRMPQKNFVLSANTRANVTQCALYGLGFSSGGGGKEA
jgi:hypothetical protein